MYQEGIDPSKDPSAKHYGHLSGPHQGKPASIWKARSQNDPTPNSPIPAIVDFDEANGGEWRKSFHGYPHGYAPGRMFSYRNTIYVQKIQHKTLHKWYLSAIPLLSYPARYHRDL